jgi:hypothetical protein
MSNTTIYNMYSSGENVLGNIGYDQGNSVPSPSYIWGSQEKLKGRMFEPMDWLVGSSVCGWGFYEYQGEKMPVTFANAASNDFLKVCPVFIHSPYWIGQTNLNENNINELLAQGIPALSSPAGRKKITPLNISDFSFDIETLDKNNGWLYRNSTYQYRWLHNDLKNMAFLYNYKLFHNLIEVGALE